jgi:hypothetical protein
MGLIELTSTICGFFGALQQKVVDIRISAPIIELVQCSKYIKCGN